MAARSYLTGCALVVLGGVVLSLGIVCVRGASASDAWQYLFWRAIGFGLVLALVAAQRHGTNPFLQVRRLGGFAWLSVLAMVASQVCFIGAIKSGSTAEVFFLFSLAPLIAAALARPLLGERIGVLGSALVSAIVLLWLGLPVAASVRDVALALLHGGVILAIGLVLFARGSRAVPGVTLVMLAQAETVVAPIWTYFVFDETTTLSVIAGGALILVAVLMQASDGARRKARHDAAPEVDASRLIERSTEWRRRTLLAPPRVPGTRLIFTARSSRFRIGQRENTFPGRIPIPPAFSLHTGKDRPRCRSVWGGECASRRFRGWQAARSPAASC